jgi:hypothetical protein
LTEIFSVFAKILEIDHKVHTFCSYLIAILKIQIASAARLIQSQGRELFHDSFLFIFFSSFNQNPGSGDPGFCFLSAAAARAQLARKAWSKLTLKKFLSQAGWLL